MPNQSPGRATDEQQRGRTGARPMVVVESGRIETRGDIAQGLEAEGFDVVTCSGPALMHTGTCPLLETSDCLLAAEASAVVYDLDIEDADDREVLLTLRARYPELPVVVEAPTRTAQRWAKELQGCSVVVPYSPEHLASAVREVVVT